MTAQQLPLDPTAIAPLRQAYAEAGYAQLGITFAQAMASKGLQIALRLHAEAIARNSK